MLLLLAAVAVKATLEEDITATSRPLLSSLINFIPVSHFPPHPLFLCSLSYQFTVLTNLCLAECALHCLLFHSDIAECTSLSYDTLRMVQSLSHTVRALMTELCMRVTAFCTLMLHCHAFF